MTAANFIFSPIVKILQEYCYKLKRRVPDCSKCGNATPIITSIAPFALIHVISSPTNTAAKINPKGIIETRNKLAIPTGMWRIALLYKKNGMDIEIIRYIKVSFVSKEICTGGTRLPDKNMYANIISVAEIIWLAVT
jgi:hypothetical protein